MTVSDEELVRLWHTDETGHDIATGLGIEPRVLYAAWRRLKREDKLPRGDRYHRGNPPNPFTPFDGRPSVEGDKAEDPLLAAFKAGKR